MREEKIKWIKKDLRQEQGKIRVLFGDKQGLIRVRSKKIQKIGGTGKKCEK